LTVRLERDEFGEARFVDRCDLCQRLIDERDRLNVRPFGEHGEGHVHIDCPPANNIPRWLQTVMEPLAALVFGVFVVICAYAVWRIAGGNFS
jgi:hypothetical protein